MKVIVLKDFVDKHTGETHGEGYKAEFEEGRAKALSSLGYVKIIEEITPEAVEDVKEEPKKESKSVATSQQKKAKK
jgi:hypothetical protein